MRKFSAVQNSGFPNILPFHIIHYTLFSSLKNICNKKDFHVARQTCWWKRPFHVGCQDKSDPGKIHEVILVFKCCAIAVLNSIHKLWKCICLSVLTLLRLTATFFFILNLARLNWIHRLKPIPCHCHATCGSNSFEFDTAVAQHLKQALYAIFRTISWSNGIPTVIRFANNINFNTLLSSLELAFYTQVCLYLAFKKLHDHLS